MVVLAVHLTLFIFTNKWRIRKLTSFVDMFRDKNLLTKREHEDLHKRYTGFLGYLEPFPSEEDFSILYKDTAFSLFVKKARWRLRQYAILTLISFALLAILLTMF